MNILMLSVGRRNELLKIIKKSMNKNSKLVATDMSPLAPALYEADRQYLVPQIDNSNYIDIITEICITEKIDVITTLIDPEIQVLAENKKRFEELGVVVLTPQVDTANICYDKYKMFEYVNNVGIQTVKTWNSLNEFVLDMNLGNFNFPVFVKPRKGSGSVGARKIENMKELKNAMDINSDLIIQEYMQGIDLDVDVYVDTISNEVISIFLKRKIETKIGGANKTISFKDEKLFDIIKNICKEFEFKGPVDMDFFYQDGKYYLSEINPRFGGAYLNAYGAGVDFVKYIENNVKKQKNKPSIGEYEENIVMMMFDSVVIKKENELIR